MNRRQFLSAASAVGMSPALCRAAEAVKIRITGLEVFRVKVNRRGNWVLFRLQTDAGLTGIGDASHGGRDDLAVAANGRRLSETIRDRSIFDVEYFRRACMAQVQRGGTPWATAFGGLEQCMWDLQGQALGVPLYRLFGGMLHERIRNYANINRSTDERTPAGFARNAESAVAAGFDAVKLAPWDGMPAKGTAAEIERFTQSGIACAEAVRRAIGEKRDLLLDAHSHFNRERGIDLARRLEPLKLYWLEEAARSTEDLVAIKSAAKMQTAGGESIVGVGGFFPYIAAHAVDIVMPDIKYCGGLLEMKKIAAMAEGAGLGVSPHGPASPVGNMAAAHVSATLPNFRILEFSHGEVPWRAELVDPPEQLERGCLTFSTRPGLGYRLHEETLRRYAADA